MKSKVALKCKIERGGFSAEKIFIIPVEEEKEYTSMASYRYCWNQNNKPLGKYEPESGLSIEGMVAARIIINNNPDSVLVSIPNGETIRVNKDQISKRPTPIIYHE